MDDRTPNAEKLELLKDSLDRWVDEIYSQVRFDNLDKDAMLGVMNYMGKTHTGGWAPGKFSPYAGSTEAVFYDIGYRLIKDQMVKESKLSSEERRLFLDGFMGWLFYNPGTAHDERMNETLDRYVESYGVERLTENTLDAIKRFAEMQKEALQARSELSESGDGRNMAYSTLFIQCSPCLGNRIMQIGKRLLEKQKPLDVKLIIDYLESM